MGDARADVSDFLRPYAEDMGEKAVLPDDADVFDRLGIDGDDAFDFVEALVERFGVDVSGYRWYFHHAEEGWNIGGLFFRAPHARVERIPITPRILADAIETKRWPLRYPDHRLPSVRWDLRLNQLLIILPLALVALWAWWRFVL